MATARDRKGAYGDARLEVAPSYVPPARRRWMAPIVVLAVLALAGLVAGDLLLGGGRILSNGPLSSGHANLAASDDCAACHVQLGTVTDERCATCHEKYGDRLGVYSFDAHYVYRSDDLSRITDDHREMACFACHPEHEGTEAVITDVPDERCITCHDYDAFDREHPEFDAIGVADDAGLRFPHLRHVREVMKSENLLDAERACLHCHRPAPDGKDFEPIDFDQHCDACHLSADTGTDFLPVRGEEQPVGVETLAALQAERAPGTTVWTFYTNPNEFEEDGGFVSKVPVHHRDRWILENLRRLRGLRYEPNDLADLLETSADPDRAERRALHAEAIATLESWALDLRGSPDPAVQEDLARIDRELERLRRRLRDPYTPLDASRFAFRIEDASVPEERRAEVEQVAKELLKPCTESCHIEAELTLERVQTAQGVMKRAEFDHRAHILQRRCLDCHARIPILEALQSGEDPDPEADRAAIQNLPGIESCRECHNRDVASQRCVTCHDFHPDEGRRSDLLLYVEEAIDAG